MVKPPSDEFLAEEGLSPPGSTVAQRARSLLVLSLRGTQEEMGAQHGQLLRQHGNYQAAVNYYRNLPELLLFGGSQQMDSQLLKWLTRAIKERLLSRLQQRRPAPYLARSRAFMESLGLPAEHARFLTVMDLFQNVVGVVGRLRLGPFARRARSAAVPACTTLAVWDGASAGGNLRHARNFDFPGVGVWDRGPAVVFCEPDRGIRYGFVTTRGADTPGITAFNEAGLVVTAHTRFHRDVSFDGASIIDVGHDIVARAETIADAIEIARERRIASTWGLAVSSARERSAVVIETTARNVEVVRPGACGLGGADDYLSCANRYRHPRAARGQVAASPAWVVHSDSRQRRLDQLVAAGRARGGLGMSDLQRTLDDRFDPEDLERPRGCGGVIGQAVTVKSIVAEPEAEVIRVSVGMAPTSRGPFVELPWCWPGQVEAHEISGPASPAPDRNQQAFEHFVEAARIAEVFHDVRAALPEFERAVALRQSDPSYRFVLGVVLLRDGDCERALEQFERGLVHERIPFRRGQLLLWGARAAQLVGDSVRAAQMRRELSSMECAELAEHRAAAQLETTQPFSRALQSIEVNALLADAQ